MTAFESTVMEKLDKLERLIKNGRQSAPKRTWVKVSIVTDLTGWNKEDMRKARDNGLVKFKRENGGFSYLLESIDEKFINK